MIASEINPTFDAYRDTVLLLTTRQNRNNPQRVLFRNQASLDASPYNPERPTRVLVHGWFEDDTSGDILKQIKVFYFTFLNFRHKG